MQFPYPTAALIATPLRTTYLSLRTAIVLPAMPILLLAVPIIQLIVPIIQLRALTVPPSIPSALLSAPTLSLAVIIVLLRAPTIPPSTPSALLRAPTVPLSIPSVQLRAPSLPVIMTSAPLHTPTIPVGVPTTPLRTSLILFPRFIFTNSGHDIIIANTDIHISRPDFPTKLLSTSPETREKTKKVAITCEKGTFQMPFRTLSPLFRPFQSLSNNSFISSFIVIWSL